MIDFVIMFSAGVWACLMGFRVLGRAPGESEAFDRWYDRFGKYLRFLGPLLCIGAFVIYLFKPH